MRSCKLTCQSRDRRASRGRYKFSLKWLHACCKYHGGEAEEARGPEEMALGTSQTTRTADGSLSTDVVGTRDVCVKESRAESMRHETPAYLIIPTSRDAFQSKRLGKPDSAEVRHAQAHLGHLENCWHESIVLDDYRQSRQVKYRPV